MSNHYDNRCNYGCGAKEGECGCSTKRAKEVSYNNRIRANRAKDYVESHYREKAKQQAADILPCTCQDIKKQYPNIYPGDRHFHDCPAQYREDVVDALVDTFLLAYLYQD